MFTPEEIGARILGQDNRCTCLPIYVVQRRRRIYGFDPDYCEDTVVWRHCDGPEADAAERELLDKAFEAGDDIPGEWTRTAYQDTWDFVMPFFTEAAAQRYIDENRHNLGPETRVFVESGYRNSEWKAIRDLLKELALRGQDGGA